MALRIWQDQTVETPDGERHLGLKVTEEADGGALWEHDVIPEFSALPIAGRTRVRRGRYKGVRLCWKARRRGRAIWQVVVEKGEPDEDR